MEAINNFVVSHEQSLIEQDALREWELALTLSGSQEKCCHTINILNGVPVVPLSLASKETRSLVSRLMDGAKSRVYSLHRMIMILYAPSVLRSATGTMAVKLFNQDSGEMITVVDDHPVAQAATFVCRWPRAVLAQSAGLALLVAVEDVNIKRGALVGVLNPFWEDKVSTKLVYEKELPTLVYPLEEQEPAFYVKDMRRLRSLVASKVLLGGRGEDIEPQTISLAKPRSVKSLPSPGQVALGPGPSKSGAKEVVVPAASIAPNLPTNQPNAPGVARVVSAGNDVPPAAESWRVKPKKAAQPGPGSASS